MATNSTAGVEDHSLVFFVVWKIVSCMTSWAWSSSWHLLEIVLTQFNENIKYLVSEAGLFYCPPSHYISDTLEKPI